MCAKIDDPLPFQDCAQRKRAEEDLARSVSLLRATLDATADGILVADLEGRIVDCNQRFIRMWQLSPELIVAGREHDLLASRAVEEEMKSVWGQLKDPEAFPIRMTELRLRPYDSSFDVLEFKDGRLFEGYSFPQMLSGQPVGRVWSFRDATQRRQSQAALRESEERFSTTFRIIPIPVSISRLIDGTFVDVNDAFCRRFGYSREEVIGHTPLELGIWPKPEERTALIAALRQSGGRIQQFEAQFRRRSGEAGVALLSASLIEVDHVQHLLVLGIDITQRTQIEAALRESKERISTIFRTIPHAVSITRIEDGAFVDVNDALCRMFGYSREELLGRTTLELGIWPKPEERTTLLATLRQTAGSVQQFEAQFRRKSGEIGISLLSAGPIELDGKQHLLIIGVDITERKLAHDEELQRHQAELAHVGRLSMMGEMAASLAHELNQPLYAIKNFAYGGICRLRGMPRPDEELVASLEKIDREARRAADVIQRMRSFAQKRPNHSVEASINDIVEEAVLLSQMEVQRLRARVRVELAKEMPATLCDPIQIEQVVANLIRNGLEAMDQTQSGERLLSIRTFRRDDNCLQVDVHDKGAGASEAKLEQLFEPFFTTKPEGLGMGLAISRSIIRAHDGRLWATVNEDRGCTFHFTLPIRKQE